MSGVFAVTVQSGKSFQSLMMAGKKDAFLYAVQHWISELSGMSSALSGMIWYQFGAVVHNFAIENLVEHDEC